MSWVTSLIMIALAAICNAVMDTVDHHFKTSKFSKLKSERWRLWFNESQGWLNKYVDRDDKKGRVKWKVLGITFNKPVQITDAWHFFKMLMIIFIDLSVTPHLPYFGLNCWLMTIVWFLLIGFIWVQAFNVFYDYILIKKDEPSISKS